jgi:phage gpG-like protein
MAVKGQGIGITLKGLKEFNKKMVEGNKKVSDGRRLHARIGINILKLVDKGFKTEGVAVTGKKWKKISAATRAARRKGPGRGGPRILQDSGDLRRSFAMDFNEKEARVGSAIKYSKVHEFGGRKKYIIKPRRKKSLRYINSRGAWVFSKEVTHPPLPRRKMLPTRKIGHQVVNKTVDNFVKKAYKKVIT